MKPKIKTALAFALSILMAGCCVLLSNCEDAEPECEPEEMECQGHFVMICDSAGFWEPVQNCAEAGEGWVCAYIEGYDLYACQEGS